MDQLLSSDLLRGRNIFVTGGGSGVNLAIAEQCAEAGASIAICGRTESTLRAAVERLEQRGAKATYAVADVRQADAVAAALDHAASVLGPMYGVVAGAAGNFMAPAERISTNGFRAVVDIDLLGSFHAAKAAFAQLGETGGSMLFVSGGPAQMPFLHQSHVAAAKAGVDQLMRSLALEWGPLGIRSNSIVPGPVEGTEGMRRLSETATAQTWADMVPLGRMARPDEVGRMAAVLLSPIASFVNGSQVVVDGGMAMTGSAPFNAAMLAAVEE